MAEPPYQLRITSSWSRGQSPGQPPPPTPPPDPLPQMSLCQASQHPPPPTPFSAPFPATPLFLLVGGCAFREAAACLMLTAPQLECPPLLLPLSLRFSDTEDPWKQLSVQAHATLSPGELARHAATLKQSGLALRQVAPSRARVEPVTPLAGGGLYPWATRKATNNG